MPMLSERDLLILNYTAVRCLVASGALLKEDLIDDLIRQGLDGDSAHLIFRAIQEMPGPLPGDPTRS